MTTRFKIGNELISPFGGGRRMKQHIAECSEMLESIRDMWELGQSVILETPFYEPFDKGPRILE
jgi:hypothetical protein